MFLSVYHKIVKNIQNFILKRLTCDTIIITIKHYLVNVRIFVTVFLPALQSNFKLLKISKNRSEIKYEVFYEIEALGFACVSAHTKKLKLYDFLLHSYYKSYLKNQKCNIPLNEVVKRK